MIILFCSPCRIRTYDRRFVKPKLLPNWAKGLYLCFHRESNPEQLIKSQRFYQLNYKSFFVSRLGFEPRTPSLKVRCSKTNWATETFYYFKDLICCMPGRIRTHVRIYLFLIVLETMRFNQLAYRHILTIYLKN